MTSVRPDPGLSRIAEDSGGGILRVNGSENLATSFAAVADELHHQYALGFEPPKLDDRMHKLDIRVNRKGLNVRARKEILRRHAQAASQSRASRDRRTRPPLRNPRIDSTIQTIR